ncbi:MAG: hypothetical protein ACE5EA_03105 [Nitrospirota bacterium]
MSLFLGPIHYIMYNRIALVNDRENRVVNDAVDKWGEKAKSVIEDTREKYGYRTSDAPLEQQIGDAPIHGWISDRLGKVVMSEAAVSNAINLQFGKEGRDLILNSSQQHGGELAQRLLKEKKTIFDSIESLNEMLYKYLLEGMPCDHCSATVSQSDKSIVIQRDLMIHAPYWLEVNVPAELMIDLSTAWVRGFVEKSGKYTFSREKISQSGKLIWEDRISLTF